MQFSKLFARWIDGNAKPASTQEQSALLDESRSAWLDIIARIESGKIRMATGTENAAAQYAKIRPNIVAPNRQVQASAGSKAPTSTAPHAVAKPVAATKAPQATPTNRYAGADEALVMQAATHRSSPEADKIAARHELEKRGFAVSPEGVISHSTRGGRAARLAKQK
jgi:hypothetical protein